MWLAKYLINKGFTCIGTMPHPEKPWLNAYKFESSPQLDKAIHAYVKGGKKKTL